VAVAIAMTLPTALAWVYFLALGGTGRPNAFQQAVYAAGKIVQFSIPLLFVAFVSRRWPVWQRPTARELLLGLGAGVLVGAALLATYHGWLRSAPLLAGAGERIRQKLGEFGVSTPAAFLALAGFLCVAHSFLEEYYWRWFVFGRLSELVTVGAAIALSSVGFMAHHVLVLWAYLPDRVLTGVVPGSLGVAAAGAGWAWLYHRTGGLAAPWLSHALIDAALFAIGWDMLQLPGPGS
jgi:membrane protease YdiL (CAAX protease family)